MERHYNDRWFILGKRIVECAEAIRARKSVRAFESREVSQEQITAILQLAGMAPSGANTQPWQVAVVTGESKNTLQNALIQAFRSGDKVEKDYTYYPIEWRDPYKERRVLCGQQLYDALNIAREDKSARQAQWERNYSAFGAPVMLLFFLEDVMQAGSYLDFGMFLQTLMLAAVDAGLATCPQAALAEYPVIVREQLGYPASMKVLCGMALGYEDKQAPVNQYRTPRQRVEEFLRIFK